MVGFAYVYWYAHQINSSVISSKTVNEIQFVTITGFYIALSICIVSFMLRAIFIKKQEPVSKWQWAFLTVTLIPILKWLVGVVGYAASI